MTREQYRHYPCLSSRNRRVFSPPLFTHLFPICPYALCFAWPLIGTITSGPATAARGGRGSLLCCRRDRGRADFPDRIVGTRSAPHAAGKCGAVAAWCGAGLRCSRCDVAFAAFAAWCESRGGRGSRSESLLLESGSLRSGSGEIAVW